MKQTASLVLVLGVFWLINSGHFQPLLLGFGALSVAGVVVLVRRMQAVDGEYQPPVLLSVRLPGYLLWLGREILVSNLDVARRVWQRRPDLSPTVFRVRAGQRGELGRTLYANSITMTPGTVTLDVHGDELTVHALTRAAAAGVQAGEMDRRVSRLEDR